ncbi:hypothetical protein BD769DRAFT_1365823, partial [Suillus cothurnatus]
LKSITYEEDENQYRYPVCALVEIRDSTLTVSGLKDGIVPILPVSNSFSFPTGEKTVSMHRMQLPILLGRAFTDFKVQGSFLPKVIFDLTGARSLQSMYVMLSRASKLKNIAILWWFSSRTLHGQLQGDAQEEMQCLQLLKPEHISNI